MVVELGESDVAVVQRADIASGAVLTGSLHTVFGWQIRLSGPANARSLRNFPMQANGAEMLRLACCLATERGVEVCAPVHDAVLMAAPLDRLEAEVARMQDVMREASEIVLAGFALNADASLIRYPERYSDPRGTVIWQRVMRLLDQQTGTNKTVADSAPP